MNAASGFDQRRGPVQDERCCWIIRARDKRCRPVGAGRQTHRTRQMSGPSQPQLHEALADTCASGSEVAHGSGCVGTPRCPAPLNLPSSLNRHPPRRRTVTDHRRIRLDRSIDWRGKELLECALIRAIQTLSTSRSFFDEFSPAATESISFSCSQAGRQAGRQAIECSTENPRNELIDERSRVLEGSEMLWLATGGRVGWPPL